MQKAQKLSFHCTNMSSQMISGIISQHAEEAAFLWLLRNAAVHQPHFSLNDLVDLDERLEAHLDGLRVAGDAAWEICKEALESGDAGEVFAAAVLAFESGDETRIQEVLEAGIISPESSRGIVSALGWLPYQQAERYIQRFLAAESTNLRRIGIASAAAHRRDPCQPLVGALLDDDPLLRAQALRAVGQLGRIDLLTILEDNLASEDDLCRFSAAWSLALLTGDANALTVLESFAASDGPYREGAMQLALRRMALPMAKGWLKKLAQNGCQMRFSIIGAGIIGDPELVFWLIAQMKSPLQARIAGEAFTMITGIDIDIQEFAGEKPEGFEAGPTENPEDENVEMDLDENLPWPKSDAIHKWWVNHQGQFAGDRRYLLGKPITPGWLHLVLRNGRQRQRAAAALELAIRQPGRPLFEIQTPGFRQKQTR